MATFKAVIGANWGDEGKGRMVDYFASKAIGSCIVVCTNGGAQRAHTVVTDDGRSHIFHHFGSGTLAGADTYLPATFIVNPIIFMQEYKELIGNHFVVYMNPNCLCSTPYDMITNQIIEEERGDRKHGSCGMGIWETVLRNEATVGEMCKMTGEELRTYLCGVRDTYFANRIANKGIDGIPTRWSQIYYSEGLINHYISDFQEMMKHVILEDNDILRPYDNIIFENGQGLLLDQNIPNSQWSTPSNTGSTNIREIVDELVGNDFVDLEICYVSRSYLTKHGAGDFPEECSGAWFVVNQLSETNVWNKNQGEFRYGRLDINNLIKRTDKDYGDNWFGRHVNRSYAITHVDEFNINTTDIKLPKYYSYGPERNKIIWTNEESW